MNIAREHELHQAKRRRHNDLELAELVDEEDEGLASSFFTEFSSLTEQTQRTGDPEKFLYHDDAQEKASVEGLKADIAGMKIVSRAKVTQNRVYCAVYHPDITKDLIFFGGNISVSSLSWDLIPSSDKHGQLGIWDAQAPQEEQQDEDGDVAPNEEQEGGKHYRLQLHWPATSKSVRSSLVVVELYD